MNEYFIDSPKSRLFFKYSGYIVLLIVAGFIVLDAPAAWFGLGVLGVTGNVAYIGALVCEMMRVFCEITVIGKRDRVLEFGKFTAVVVFGGTTIVTFASICSLYGILTMGNIFAPEATIQVPVLVICFMVEIMAALMIIVSTLKRPAHILSKEREKEFLKELELDLIMK